MNERTDQLTINGHGATLLVVATASTILFMVALVIGDNVGATAALFALLTTWVGVVIEYGPKGE